MFQTIFRHEIQYWLRQPYMYLFAIILFGISFLSMWGMASEAAGGPGAEIMNSYYRINFMSNYLSMLMLFLLPGTIGASVYRDYKSQMYTLLYAYPITKPAYLLAKFTAAFLVVMAVVSTIGVGFILGTQMPGVQSDVIAPFSLMPYLQLYGWYLLPNMLLFGLIIFAIVLKTRNIYVGFIALILLVVFQGAVKAIFSTEQLAVVAALLDPSGDTAMKYTIRFWTKADRNTLPLPWNGLVLYNRFLWLSISSLVAVYIYRTFSFQQFTTGRKRAEKNMDNSKSSHTARSELSIPTVTYNIGLWQQVKTCWYTAVADFRFIVFSWPFLALLITGAALVYFQQHEMNPAYGFEILPTTGRMLQVPMFIFGLVINLLSFLYIGILQFRGETSRMGEIINTVPQPDWLLMLSRLGAVLLMQITLLTLVLLCGILAQTIQGYYRYELWHYCFELFGLQLIHFAIWAMVAVFVYTLVNNLYLGFFLLLLLPTAVSGLRVVANFMDWPFLRQSILQFNQVPGVTVGFTYSDFSGYGGRLPLYFAFKSYWFVFTILLLLVSLLLWPRVFTFSQKERWQLAIQRFRGKLRTGAYLCGGFFLVLGGYLYMAENYWSKAYYTESDQEQILVRNEKRYARYEGKAQPRIAAAKIQLDIYPEEENYKAQGELLFINKVNHSIDTILVSTSFREETSYSLVNPNQLISQDSAVRFDIWKLDEPLAPGDSLRLTFEVSNYPNSLLQNNSRASTNGTFISSNILPRLGFRSRFLTDEKKRADYGLPKRPSQERSPLDTTLLGYAFAENNMDRIHYETTVSTSSDQVSFSMGKLISRWQEGDRSFAHFRSEGPIVNTISWISGRYVQQNEQADDHLQLQLLQHAAHGHNNEHILAGTQASLNYCSQWFGDLNYDTIRLIEFPITEGTYATLNGNLVPYSEALFMCDIDAEKNDVFNMPFYSAAHEVAHYWWGHRVDPANVDGGKMLTESLAEYLALQVMENEFGLETVLDFRKKMQKVYLRGRAKEGAERPLYFVKDHQDYLSYQKGSLALYAMAQIWGEEPLNQALASFEEEHRYTEPPYPTSLSMLQHLEDAIPDSLGYLLEDYFQTITLYNNQLQRVQSRQNNDQTWTANVVFSVEKNRYDASGNIASSTPPLSDFIQIGFYETAEQKLPTVVKTVRIEQVANTMEFDLDFEAQKVTIDPYQLLFDKEREDNSKRME